MCSRDKRRVLTCTLTATIAFGACSAQEKVGWDELPKVEQEAIRAEVEAGRERTRLAMVAGKPVQQALFIPCPQPICYGSDIVATSVVECGAFYPAHIQDCDGLACDWYTYEALPPPAGGMARFWFETGTSMVHGSTSVCFEIDTYVGTGRRGVPNVGWVPGPDGYLYGMNDSQKVHLETGYHAFAGVWGHTEYNTGTSGGSSSGQEGNESGWHSLPPGAGWISSAAGIYSPQW